MSSVEEFVSEFTQALIEGYAAVFAGAGLSRPSGLVDWKELVAPLAKSIKLDVEKEQDLVAVAQYYKNEHRGQGSIEQRILNSFTKNVEVNENIRILTRLPITTYWTTNYDSLLEDGLAGNNRKADIKITQKSLARNIYDRDAVVYKMHGDARFPEHAVLTKDDYEAYGISHPLFRTVLQGDLVSKTFLFIGFSFEDPNLDYVLSQIRILLGESQRSHYCFFEKITQHNQESSEDYAYRTVKQELRIKDLQRYGIQAVLLNNYGEIPIILRQLERNILLRNVFISGSIAQYSEVWPEKNVQSFVFKLAQQLVKNDFKVITGFGLGIGSSVINGALDEIMNSKYKHIDEHLCPHPFPQTAPAGGNLSELWRNYREHMIAEAGIAIFMFGNKFTKTQNGEDHTVELAGGMIQEFEIAKKNSLIIIPIGSTGWAAQQIFNNVTADIDSYPYLKDHLEVLSSSCDVDTLVRTVCTIVDEVQADKCYP